MRRIESGLSLCVAFHLLVAATVWAAAEPEMTVEVPKRLQKAERGEWVTYALLPPLIGAPVENEMRFTFLDRLDVGGEPHALIQSDVEAEGIFEVKEDKQILPITDSHPLFKNYVALGLKIEYFLDRKTFLEQEMDVVVGRVHANDVWLDFFFTDQIAVFGLAGIEIVGKPAMVVTGQGFPEP